MIGYVTLGTDDIERARAYFDALFGTIGAKRLMQFDDDSGFTMWGTGMGQPGIVVTKPYNKESQDCGNGNMIAIPFDTKDKVDAFHAKAIELGGSDEGAPGYRGDPSFGYYFAYFRDPDGHKFAAFNMAGKAA